MTAHTCLAAGQDEAWKLYHCQHALTHSGRSRIRGCPYDVSRSSPGPHRSQHIGSPQILPDSPKKSPQTLQNSPRVLQKYLKMGPKSGNLFWFPISVPNRVPVSVTECDFKQPYHKIALASISVGSGLFRLLGPELVPGNGVHFLNQECSRSAHKSVAKRDPKSFPKEIPKVVQM